MRHRARSTARIVAGIALALLAGCQTVRDVGGDLVYQASPVGSTNLVVGSVDAHGPYLLAALEGRREQLRMLAPIDASCVALLRPEARVAYEKSGVFGRVADATQHCDLIGVASLEAWRDRQPRRRVGLAPRARASFTLREQDPQLLLARGRFPLASKLGIPAAYDLVALLPNDAPCREAIARGEASLEFRPAGRDPLRLVVDDAACVIAGFAMPPAGP